MSGGARLLRTAGRAATSYAAQQAFFGAALATALFATPALAHEFRPSLLDVTAIGEGRYQVRFSAAPGGERLSIVFPERCKSDVTTGILDCGKEGLSGQRISVRDMAPLRDEVLLRLHLPGGADQTAMLTAARPSFEVPSVGTSPAASPASRGATSTIASFAAAGAAHLVTGLDHVLFLIGVLFLCRGARAILLAVTAFTVAHSIALALQVLSLVRLPPAPVEAAIALSVLFVAREILRPPERPTLAQRRPHVITFAFGLLHGLGFAGGLASMEVPRAEIPAALFGFNAGLEIAQVGLVIAALATARLVRPYAARSPVWTRRVPAYSLGAVAAFWLFSRTAAFWS